MESFDFGVIVSASESEAVDILKNSSAAEPISLVIANWKMTATNGTQTLATLSVRAAAEQIPSIVMVTADSRTDEKRQAEAAGFTSVLAKPISASALFDAIMEVFHKEPRRREETSPTHNAQDISDVESLEGLRVLLVEDNVVSQQVACEILQSAGIEAEVADNGKIAVERVESEQWDCVLMDVQMPVMDGYQAVRLIRENEEKLELPVIAMTANAMKGDREKCLAAGMDDYITKPINPRELFEALARWAVQAGGDAGSGGASVDFSPEPVPKEPAVELDGIDVQSAVKRLGIRPEIYYSILDQFREDFRKTGDAIRRYADAGNYEEAERAAHSVKGAAGNIGAAELQESAALLEKWYRQGNKGLPEPQYGIFSSALERVLKSLSKLENYDQGLR